MQANGQQPLGQLPTTIEMALLPSTESRVITEPEEPFRILHVNDVWCHVCGYDAEEVIGETCAVLQGPGTCRATLGMLKQALNFKRNFAVQLLNYTKQGKPFMNTLQVTPLVDSHGRVTHYLGVVIARSLDGTGVPMSVSDPTANPYKPDAHLSSGFSAEPPGVPPQENGSKVAALQLRFRRAPAAPALGALPPRAAPHDGANFVHAACPLCVDRPLVRSLVGRQ